MTSLQRRESCVLKASVTMKFYANAEQTERLQSSLLNLPPELRFKIYSMLPPKTSLPETDFDNAIRHWGIFRKQSNYVVHRTSFNCKPYQQKVCPRIFQRTNLWKVVQGMREPSNDFTILSKEAMKRLAYRSSAENPLIGLMLSCMQVYQETMSCLPLIYPFQTQYDGGILRNLGFQDEIVHPFLQSKDVLSQIRKLTLSIRFFRPLCRLSQPYEFSSKFHYYHTLRKLTSLDSIRICISYICVTDEVHDLPYVTPWNAWDRTWLAKLLLHLLTLIPTGATVIFFEKDSKSISAALMRRITHWLQDQLVQEKPSDIKKTLCSTRINEDGEVQIDSV